ncbi:MAG TPA: NADH-quinone oxidoreductase subunit NuoN [Cellvibrio sp.]|nr:NADH-quinone oxidoreductase subunit NuoN [Cellvibrio sp.]
MTFTLENLQALLPLLITCATTIFVMLAIAIKRNHWWNATVTVIGLNIALLSSYYALKVIPQTVTPLFVVDGFSLFFSGLILIAALGATTLTNAYIESFKRNREEIYLLITIATAGGIVLSFSHHMASLFIGLEMMSVALYGMVAYTYDRARSLEAAIKYLVLSATASAIMLFGIALIYAQIGSLAFSEIGAGITQEPSLLIVVGGMMLLIGLFFKLSLAPFHLWTPDVYEGAPAPVGAFLATAAKVAVFAVLVRFAILESNSVLASTPFVITLIVVACISMMVGNLLALKQNNIKRMLGYSSIAHFGYLLLLVLVGGQKFGIEGFAVYLTIYVITSLAAFGVVTLMSQADGKRDADMLSDYRGLFWRRPYLASIFTLSLFSLAGIPLTAGFIGKFYVVTAAVGAGFWGWIGLIFVVLGSSIGIFFYLRTIISLFLAKKHMHRFDAEINWGQRTGGIMVLGAAAFILVIGIIPNPLMFIAQLTQLLWVAQ